MPRALAALLVASVAFMPGASVAQSASSDPALGHRLFIQNCGVCHLKPQPTSRRYGPELTRADVEGNDAAIRELVLEGSPNMPGFRYDLAPAQVDAIVAYLKTITPPVQPSSAPPAVTPVTPTGRAPD